MGVVVVDDCDSYRHCAGPVSALAVCTMQSVNASPPREIVCRRCQTKVVLEEEGGSLSFAYEVERWLNSGCCCGHLGGPIGCCSFLELEGVVTTVLNARSLPH